MQRGELTVVLAVGDPARRQAVQARLADAFPAASVVLVSTTAEAHDALHADPALDLCLIDDTPGGPEALLAHAATHPALPAVVVLRDASDDDRALRLLEAGAADVLAPPEDHDGLGAPLRRLLARRRAARLQHRAAAEFRAMVENTLDIITVLDRNGLIRYESPAMATLLGHDPKDLVGQNAFAFIHPDDAERVFDLFLQGIREPGFTTTVEYRFRHRDGSWRLLESRAKNLLDDPVVHGIVVNSRDVTERRRAEAALGASEARVRDLAATAADAVVVADAQGLICDWNRGAERTFGYTKEEVLGRSVECLIPDAYVALHRQAMARLLASGEGRFVATSAELQGRRSDGASFPIELSLSTWSADGEQYFTAIIRDITERKRTEAALHERSALVQLLQQIAVAANAADTIEDVLPLALDQVCTYTGWPVGHAYLPTPDGLLASARRWHLADAERFAVLRRVSEETPVAPGEDMPGRVFAMQRPLWLVDVMDDPDFPRARLASDLGVHGAFAFPVTVGSEVVAVLEFFSEREEEPNAALLDVMTHIGAQLGRVVERRRAEAALRRSEAHTRALLDAIPDAMVRVARDGTYLAYKIPPDFEWTMDPATFVGSSTYDQLPAPLAERMMDAILRAIDTGRMQTIEYEVELDGRTRHREARVVASGPDEAISIMRDITERRRSEDALRRSEARNRALIDALPDAVVRLDRHGTYLDIRLPEDYGSYADPQALIGSSAYDLLPPEIAAHARRCVDQALETGRLQSFEYELDVGGERHVREARVVRVGPDEVISIQRDITERKQAEEEIRRLKAFYEQLLHDMPADLAVMEPDGRIIYLNPASVRDPEMRAWLIGKTGEDYCRRRGIDPEIARRRQHYIDQAVRERRIVRFEESMPARDGAIHHILRMASPVVNTDGRVDHVIGYGLDITERKLYEQQLKQSREHLRELAQHLQTVREEERTRISREVHDVLGQAMTALRLDVAWIEKGLTETQDALFARLAAMKQLIDETIRTARRIASELRPGILDDLGLAAALEWQTQEFARRTGLDYAFADDCADLELDRQRATTVFRIFQESLTNIARHAHAARVTVRLRCEDGDLVLDVRDDGRGIRPDELAHAKSLGLLGMRERAQVWGGKVEVTGAPGEGTTMTLRLPLPTDESLPA